MRAPLLKLSAAGLTAALLLLVWYAFHLNRSLHQPLAFGTQERLLVIAPGTSFKEIMADLKRKGMLSDTLALEVHARWSGHARGVQAGEYQIDPGVTPLEMLDQLLAGKVVQHSLTLVDGWVFDEVLAAVRAHPAFEHTLPADLESSEIMERLGYSGIHPEGRFLADTYHFPRGTTDVAFLRRAYRSMQRFLDKAWDERAPDLPYESPVDALILASIIEKETGLAGERAEISGVLVRRLKQNMCLEADPTVIYGLGEEFDGNLRRTDLRRDTPYNTYVHRGLPPTPIAMPGTASILAALHPLAGETLFFVAKGDGSHYFSTTYREHREAVSRYQKNQRSSIRENGSES